jgi:RNA polymerase sigma factor (sigma-70 family)
MFLRNLEVAQGFAPRDLPFSRVEVTALRHHGAAGLRGPTPLLRLQGDERLIALTRRGNDAAYEALVARYQSRLLSFCRHMLGSREDAEDVLQEVFAAAFNAIVSDDRPINVRPWLYRIARNRCLNHLRKQTAIGVDSMDVHLADHGTTTADRVHDREEFRQLVADVQTLPETQRTALLLREIDALSYEQIAEAMETTVPSVKSLLVRARVSLAEATESRKLTCDEVREELGEWAEGLQRISPPVRRHVRACTRCSAFKKQLTQTNKALAAVFPLGPLLLLKKFVVAQGAGGAAAASASAAGAGASAAGGAAAGSALSAGVTAIATKTAAGLAAAAIVTAGAVEVDQVQRHHRERAVAPASAVAQVPQAPAVVSPRVVRSVAQPGAVVVAPARRTRPVADTPSAAAQKEPAAADAAIPATAVPAETVAASELAPQQESDTAALPAQPDISQAQFVPGTPAPAAVPTPASVDQVPAGEPQPGAPEEPATTTTTSATPAEPPAPAAGNPSSPSQPSGSAPSGPPASSGSPAGSPPSSPSGSGPSGSQAAQPTAPASPASPPASSGPSTAPGQSGSTPASQPTDGATTAAPLSAPSGATP